MSAGPATRTHADEALVTEMIFKAALKQMDKEIPWKHIPEAERVLYEEAEAKQWREHVHYGAGRVLTPEETEVTRRDLPRERILMCSLICNPQTPRGDDSEPVGFEPPQFDDRRFLDYGHLARHPASPGQVLRHEFAPSLDGDIYTRHKVRIWLHDEKSTRKHGKSIFNNTNYKISCDAYPLHTRRKRPRGGPSV